MTAPMQGAPAYTTEPIVPAPGPGGRVRRLRLTRTVTRMECDWLPEDLPEGTLLYQWFGATYGCIRDGVACSFNPGEYPFVEVPRDALVGDL